MTLAAIDRLVRHADPKLVLLAEPYGAFRR